VTGVAPAVVVAEDPDRPGVAGGRLLRGCHAGVGHVEEHPALERRAAMPDAVELEVGAGERHAVGVAGDREPVGDVSGHQMVPPT